MRKRLRQEQKLQRQSCLYLRNRVAVKTVPSLTCCYMDSMLRSESRFWVAVENSSASAFGVMAARRSP